MKTIIEQYIQFAIDNGYKDLDGYKFLGIKYEIDHILGEFETNSGKYSIQFLGNNILEIITSKTFIESIARGYIKKEFNQPLDENQILEIIDNLTKRQSFAIRDNILEEFIIELGIGVR